MFSHSSVSSIQSLLGHSTEKEYQLPSYEQDSDLENAKGSTGQISPEKCSTSKFIDGRTISDAIIGLSDGLTVPFALTAGLSALEDTKVVVFGGLAELIAGAISMGLGGYLGAKSEMYVCFLFASCCSHIKILFFGN